jgi:hypothetical protein
MSVRSIIFIVTSPRPRVGKTLLARLLTDFQSQNGRPVAAFDLNPHENALAEYPPEQTTVASIADIKGQMALFDRLVAEDGITKVIDLGHDAFEAFFRIARDIGLADETWRRSIAPVILYVGTPDRTSVEAYAALRPLFPHGTMVPVFNDLLGTVQYRMKFPPSGTTSVTVNLPALPPALRRAVERRPFSFFETSQAAAGDLSLDAHLELQQWLRRIFLEFREMELNVLLADLQSALQAHS